MKLQMQRIVVIGTSGSGKTTLARRLAHLLGYPHVELDALHWEANWVEAQLEIFRERVTRALAGECWVMDGNYSKARDIAWGRADTIIWLDFPLALSLWRLLRRTMRRIFLRERLWNGNRESLRGAFIGRESLFAWAITSHARHQRDYPGLLKEQSAHLHATRLKTPAEVEAWVKNLET